MFFLLLVFDIITVFNFTGKKGLTVTRVFSVAVLVFTIARIISNIIIKSGIIFLITIISIKICKRSEL